MLIKINGVTMPSYEEIHQAVEEHTSDSILEHLTETISSASWNQYDREELNLFENFDHVQSYCGNNLLSWMDAFNYSVMDSHPATKTVYNFVQNRAEIVREGFTKEGQHIADTYGQYQLQTHEYVQGLWDSFGEHIADVLQFIVMMFI